MRITRIISGVSLAIVFFVGESLAASYTVTDLGKLGGLDYASINNSGQVAGRTTIPFSGGSPIGRAALISKGTVTELGAMWGDWGTSGPTGINDSGKVVGWSKQYDDSVTRATLFSNGTVTDLGALGGYNCDYSAFCDSSALSINNFGQVVGWSITAHNDASHATLFSNGTVTDLGTLGGTTSSALSINNSGQAVGWSYTVGSAVSRAVLFNNGTVTDLGTLGGTASSALSINDSGQTVGWSYSVGDAVSRAVLFSNGTVTDLGTLGGSASSALSINDFGQAVGWSYTAGNVVSHAALFSNGTVTDLQSLIDPSTGWTLTGANDINNIGQIVGYGNDNNGQRHALLLTPVPEPSAILLLGSSLAGLIIWRRKRQN